ncbi:MAG: ABC-F family ATP-binding cassette domain-containing protein [Planctomycetaceae bacterium]|nr:ABC-F family ATP-binding cassette domain-containing protein [Planctomycetaceae bacterium]
MTIIAFSEIHKSFGPELVFDGLGLNFYASAKVGLIGPNGSGKTTLFRMILGDEKPDSGRIALARDLKIGYLPQEPTFSHQRTVMEEMHDGMAELLGLHNRIEHFCRQMETLSGPALQSAMKEYDRLCHRFQLEGGYSYEARIKTILAGLDIGPEHYHANTGTLSGGQLSRLGLAKVLVKDTNLLLLDEPTNHLDLQAVSWLQTFLANYAGAAIVVSHDRYLLDKVAQKIVELRNRRAFVWKGNYSQYIQTRDQAVLEQERTLEKRREFVARTLDFIARNKDQEGMRKTARGRKTRLERLLKENPDFLQAPDSSKTVRFSFADTEVKSDLVLRAENVKKAFGPLTLFENLTFDVTSGQRLGITGPNGAGKTTLLRLALAQETADSGTIRLGPNLRVGYLDQQGTTLEPAHTVLAEARAVRPDLSEEVLRGKLGSFLFSGEDVFKTIADLSGGQQSRLMLCKLVLSEPDVLILDEPTNHLDIPSREMLEEALLDYNGAVIAVSHDRYFLDRAAETLLVIGEDAAGGRQIGSVQLIQAAAPGDEGVYSTWARIAEQNRLRAEQQAIAEKKKNQRHSQDARAATKTPAHLKHLNKYTLEQLEQMITGHERQIEEMQTLFAAPEVYQSRDKLTQLQADLKARQAELATLYEAWQLRAE